MRLPLLFYRRIESEGSPANETALMPASVRRKLPGEDVADHIGRRIMGEGLWLFTDSFLQVTFLLDEPRSNLYQEGLRLASLGPN